jgi:hypothetical protein
VTEKDDAFWERDGSGVGQQLARGEVSHVVPRVEGGMNVSGDLPKDE